MTRRLRVLFLTVCATVVSVAMWVVVIVLNLIWALFGETEVAWWAGWTVTLISAGVFFAVFYRHFSRTER